MTFKGAELWFAKDTKEHIEEELEPESRTVFKCEIYICAKMTVSVYFIAELKV